MKELGAKLAKEVLKLNKKKDFAVRPRRSGGHGFTSQDIGRDVGSAINVKTGAKVNLTDPKNEIFVECRQSTAYLFVDRVEGPGGMPLGTAGKALVVLDSEDSVAAGWLIMKRGCWLGAFGDNKLAKELEKWHIGKKIQKYPKGDAIEVAWKNRFRTIVVSEKVKKKLLDRMYDKKLLVLRPLVGLKPSQKRAILARIHSN